MKSNSNDLYAQILGKLEEKQNNNIEKKEKENNFVKNNENENIEVKNTNNKSKSCKNRNKKNDYNKIEEHLNTDCDKKMRKLLKILIVIQLLLLSVMLYLLYHKIFDTKMELNSNFLINQSLVNEEIFSEDGENIPNISIDELLELDEIYN